MRRSSDRVRNICRSYNCCQHHPGRTDAALCSAAVNKCLLDSVELVVIGDTFNGRNRGAIYIPALRQADRQDHRPDPVADQSLDLARLVEPRMPRLEFRSDQLALRAREQTAARPKPKSFESG